MPMLDAALHAEVTEALRKAGRADLAARLPAVAADGMVTTTQAARLLGVASPNTVKNWLAGGHFPGARRTPGGHWRFSRLEVEAVKLRMAELRARNRRGDLAPPDIDDEAEVPVSLAAGGP